MNVSVSYLENKRYADGLTIALREIINILLATLNDWPKPINNLAEFEVELARLMGDEINKNKIEEFLSKVDYSKNAWEAESLSQLIEVYQYYEENKSLRTILNELEKKLRNSDSVD